jgi:hypothetical protein
MSTAVASPYLFTASPTGITQAEGWSNGAVLVDCVFAATLGSFLGATPPVIVKLSIAAASLDIFPTGTGTFTKFVVPWEHRAAEVTVHFADGTADASLPESSLVMLVASFSSAGNYTVQFISITHDEFPNHSLMLVNVSDITIGTSRPYEPDDEPKNGDSRSDRRCDSGGNGGRQAGVVH